jgi:hypothetical protein
MNQKAAVLGGIGLGIGLMYLLDPAMGRRRRALMRDKTVRYWTRTCEALGTASRDVSNRVMGAAAEFRSGSTGNVDDSVLEARVRSRMGRVVSHPSAVTVSAMAGRVALGGDILRSEADTLLRAVSKVPGVQSIENNLQTHETAENVAALQGSGRTARSGVNPRTWPPSTRLLAGAAGTALAVYGIAKAAAPRPQPRWRRILSAAGAALAGIPQGMSYVSKGVSYIPKGASYVPKGLSYIPKGVSYLPRFDSARFRSWSPTARIIAAGTGAALTFYSIARARDRRRKMSGWRRVWYDVSNLRHRVPPMSVWRGMPARVAHSMPWVH